MTIASLLLNTVALAEARAEAIMAAGGIAVGLAVDVRERAQTEELP